MADAAFASADCDIGDSQPLTLPGAGSTTLDGEDFLVSNLLLSIGSLVYPLFCVMRWGWGFDRYLAEANDGAA